jgi:hypothetical protein
VSFDLFVQGFHDGNARDADRDALRVALAPYVVSGTSGATLRAAASTAEIYGLEDLARGFMVTHVDGGEIFDVLVDVAAACDLVILPVGVSTAITREEQRVHLPDELRDEAVLVRSGAELRALIAGHQ